MSVYMNKDVATLRRRIVREYREVKLGSGTIGGTFGEILCHELHHGGDSNGLHFAALAEKWNIGLPLLGDAIADHCRRLPRRRRAAGGK